MPRKLTEARKEYNRAYYLKNKERINTPEQKAYQARWYQENKDRIAEEYRSNPELQLQRSRQKKYGVSPAWVDMTLKDQEGKCAICGVAMTGENRKLVPHVDHCHDTGLVRGLLCQSCNVGLGRFEDNVDRLEAALRYLRQHKH